MTSDRDRKLRRAWPALLALTVVAAFLAWSRTTHASAPWQLDPDRIILCDRTYQRVAGDSPMSQDEMAEAERPRSLERVGRIPPVVGRPVLAVRTERVPGWDLCAAGLYLQVGDDAFRRYGLVGGF